MKSHLKVKVFTLGAEMSYIHRQEIKWKEKARVARQKARDPKYLEDNFWSLRHHRKELKVEARHTHLAYGFMKGRSYREMEQFCYGDIKGYGSTPPDWAKIEQMIDRFSQDEPDPRDVMQKFSEWLASAKEWYDGNPDRIQVLWVTQAQNRERLRNDPVNQDARRKASEAWRAKESA